MPIRIDEFKKDRPPDPSRLIRQFLQANQGYAYTLEELLEELASKGVNLRVEEAETVLGSLEVLGWIKSQVIHDVKYYTYRMMGFRAR